MTEFKDSLLALTSYPDPTPDYIVDQAADFSKLMGARTLYTHIRAEPKPGSTHALDGGVADRCSESDR